MNPKTGLLLFPFLFCFNLFGQKSELHYTKIDTNYTWRNSTLAERESFYFDLPNVEKSSYKTHFRISLSRHIIDFFSDDGEHFKGVLTHFVKERGKVKSSWPKIYRKDKMVSRKVLLEDSISTVIARGLLSSGIDSIPPDSLIQNWNMRPSDCMTIQFKFRLSGNYSNKSYRCPWSQVNRAKHAELIVSIYDSLKNKLDLQNRFNQFTNILPRGKWYNVGGNIRMRNLTKRESKKRTKLKLHREYLAPIKDSVDSYLEAKLAEQEIDMEELDCFQDFHLRFGKNGQLQRVYLSKESRPSLSYGLHEYLLTRRETRHCKKLIRKLFKPIDLCSFDLQYRLHRTISFGIHGEIHLEDVTIYH